MQPLKCRFCGVSEWRHVCGAGSPVVLPSKKAVVHAVVHKAEGVAAKDRGKDRHKRTDARRAYVREKTRAYRASRKEVME